MHELYEMKDKLIREASQQFANGIQSINTHEMGEVIDMIKDLAEAEKACAEAEYYESVVDAMEDQDGWSRYGYDPGRDGRGYQQSYAMMDRDQGQDRMGYRDSKGRYSTKANARRSGRMGGRSGYSEESIDNLREIMQDADPARREQLKKDLQQLMSEM